MISQKFRHLKSFLSTNRHKRVKVIYKKKRLSSDDDKLRFTKPNCKIFVSIVKVNFAPVYVSSRFLNSTFSACWTLCVFPILIVEGKVLNMTE